MKHWRYIVLPALAGWMALSVPAAAQVAAAPQVINFQGRLNTAAGSPVADGTYSVTVSLWDAATGGNQKWSQTLGTVDVKGGLFSVLLTTNTTGLFNGTNLWLQTQVGTDPAMTPREQIASVPFAIKANTVPDASVSSTQLSSDAASFAKVSGGALTLSSGKLGIGNTSPVKTLDIGSAAVPGSEGMIQLESKAASGGASRIWDIGVPQTGSDVSGAGYSFVIDDTQLGTTPELMVKYGTGNVGLGTVTPTERLTLNGKMAFQQSAGDDPNAGKLDYRGFDPGSLSLIGAGTASGNRNVRLYDTLSVGYGAPTGAAAAFNGNVGVGTSTPAQRLDVRGGNMVVTNAAGKVRTLVANNATVDMGYVQIVNTSDKTVVGLGGNVSNGGDMFVADATGATTVDISGTGEITAKIVTVTGGSDVAEPYHVSAAASTKPLPGMLVAMDPEHDGQMTVASHAYDPMAGGIISGANGIAPGITLRQKGTIADGELPVATVGRVWCYADADANGPIEKGNLLTTSDTPGYAMKVTDFSRANGAVIGKAMTRLASGKGLVLVLVSLR